MFLIIQNGYIVPCLPKYLDETYIIIKSYELDVSNIDLDGYTIVIILGGHQSLTTINKYPYLNGVINLIKKCIQLKKPIFAICLGAQLVAYTLGCQIKSSDKVNVGYNINILDQSNIFRYHIDYIVPNDKIVVKTAVDNMPYLYLYQDYIVGIQCHPDLTPECVIKYSNHDSSIKYALSNKETIDKANYMVINKIINFLIKRN